MLAFVVLATMGVVDMSWPMEPKVSIDHVDDCSCLSGDLDGADPVLVDLDVDDELTPVLPFFTVPDPRPADRLVRRDPWQLPRAPNGDDLFRPPRPRSA
jgi:hypothetical protein